MFLFGRRVAGFYKRRPRKMSTVLGNKEMRLGWPLDGVIALRNVRAVSNAFVEGSPQRKHKH